MNENYQQFIKEFKTLIEKEKISNRAIQGKIIRIHENILDISIESSHNLTKNMSVEVNRVNADIIFIKQKNITVMVENESVFKVNQRVSIHNVQKDIVIHKLQESLDNINNNDISLENKDTLNVLFEKTKPVFNNKMVHVKCLNENQKMAVEKSLQSNKFHLIQGPPGTGKTHTIIEIIKQLHKENKSLLITTHTHIALDNILERLELDEKEILRIGKNNKISSKTIKYTMDSHIKRHPAYWVIVEKEKLIEKLESDNQIFYSNEIVSNQRESLLSKFFKAILPIKNNEDESYNSISNQSNIDNVDSINQLKLEIDHIRKNIQSDILGNIKIFASTVISSSGFLTKDLNFDYVIMDEASQVPVYLSLIPLLKTNKFILIGDNKQLQPIRNENSSYTLNKSIFNHLIEKYPDNYTFLNIQYRMNEEISNIASKLYYGNKLLTASKVRNRKIKLKNTNNFLLDEGAITVIDTSNLDFYESKVSGGCCNKHEAMLIVNLVNALNENNVSLAEIGIITPYRKQKNFINKKLKQQNLIVECDTIYRFQGREKDVIIVSFCKSSNQSLTNFQKSFLGDENQLNVSITRSRKKLILIGNLDLLKTSDNIRNMFEEISIENIICLEDILLI